MTRAHEDTVDRTLRWMTENLMGAYESTYPPGHEHAGRLRTNSGTCILVCCYISALGKVLLKGTPSRDFERFSTFLQLCMKDFLRESNAAALPPTPKGRSGGDGWLYEVFRCGFVHSFYPARGTRVAWRRNVNSNNYWFMRRSRLTLNIDELVRGFIRGLAEFRNLVAADADLRTRFKDYIFAE